MIKRFMAFASIVLVLSSCEALSQVSGGTNTGGGVTENEAGMGIKEALGKGITNAVLQLNTQTYVVR